MEYSSLQQLVFTLRELTSYMRSHGVTRQPEEVTSENKAY